MKMFVRLLPLLLKRYCSFLALKNITLKNNDNRNEMQKVRRVLQNIRLITNIGGSDNIVLLIYHNII
jgi:hypothetical protein